jgi:hypothetical protein
MDENIKPIDKSEYFLDKDGNVLETDIEATGIRHVEKPKSKRQ